MKKETAWRYGGFNLQRGESLPHGLAIVSWRNIAWVLKNSIFTENRQPLRDRENALNCEKIAHNAS
jgi:hypothetical protein